MMKQISKVNEIPYSCKQRKTQSHLNMSHLILFEFTYF